MPRFFNPDAVCAPLGLYTHGVEVQAGARLVYFSGQVGLGKDGNLPSDFESQVTNTFQNIAEILKDAGMDFGNLVKMTIFLINREDTPKMREVRTSFLGEHKPASTLLYISGLASSEMLIEVEGVAAKD